MKKTILFPLIISFIVFSFAILTPVTYAADSSSCTKSSAGFPAAESCATDFDFYGPDGGEPANRSCQAEADNCTQYEQFSCANGACYCPSTNEICSGTCQPKDTSACSGNFKRTACSTCSTTTCASGFTKLIDGLDVITCEQPGLVATVYQNLKIKIGNTLRDIIAFDGPCANGAVVKWDNTNDTWACGIDKVGEAGSTYVKGTGININGDIIETEGGLANVPTGGACSGNSVLKWNNSAWVCGTDATGGNQTLGISGHTITLTGSDSVTVPDNDTTYSYMSNKGLQKSGNSFGIKNCDSNEVLKYINNQWLCRPDIDTNTQLSEAQVNSYVSDNGYLTSYTDTSAATECSPGYLLNGDGTCNLITVGDITSVSAGTGLIGTTTAGPATLAVNSHLADLADGLLSTSKMQNGTFMINSTGTYGQVWKSDGSGAGVWESDVNTNANTLCTGTSKYLDGEGNCDTLITNTNAKTICNNGQYLNGNGNCYSMPTDNDTQNLSISGHTISLVDGGSVTVPDNNNTYTNGGDLDLTGNVFSVEDVLDLNQINFANNTTGITFDGDTTNTRIYANSQTTEDLYLEADDDIVLAPDDDIYLKGDHVYLNENAYIGMEGAATLEFDRKGISDGKNIDAIRVSSNSGFVVKGSSDYSKAMYGPHLFVDNMMTDSDACSFEVDGTRYPVGTDYYVKWNNSCGYFFRTNSSQKYKDNIQNLSYIKEDILKLQPRTYTSNNGVVPEIGMIAEEVYSLVPDLVVYDVAEGPSDVKYEKLSLYLLEIIKEQEKDIDKLQLDYDELKNSISNLNNNN